MGIKVYYTNLAPLSNFYSIGCKCVKYIYFQCKNTFNECFESPELELHCLGRLFNRSLVGVGVGVGPRGVEWSGVEWMEWEWEWDLRCQSRKNVIYN